MIFTFCPGESVALVGHTGAGKSSIAKLVTRFYEFQAGDLDIDGIDIRTFDLQDYRRQLGIVSQTPFLFAGTVADNIRYATPETQWMQKWQQSPTRSVAATGWRRCPTACKPMWANVAHG